MLRKMCHIWLVRESTLFKLRLGLKTVWQVPLILFLWTSSVAFHCSTPLFRKLGVLPSSGKRKVGFCGVTAVILISSYSSSVVVWPVCGPWSPQSSCFSLPCCAFHFCVWNKSTASLQIASSSKLVGFPAGFLPLKHTPITFLRDTRISHSYYMANPLFK